MDTRPRPSDPRARLRAAERDIEHYVELLAGDGLTYEDIAKAALGIRVAARARRLAREQIHRECKEQSETWRETFREEWRSS